MEVQHPDPIEQCKMLPTPVRAFQNPEELFKHVLDFALANCPFEVAGKKDDDVLTLIIKHANHNDEPSRDTLDIASGHDLTDEKVLVIREMSLAGKQPRQNLKLLRQKKPFFSKDPRNISNVMAKMSKEISSGNLVESMVLSGMHNLETNSVRETKALVCELCRHFYSLGWLLGTGGSITVKVPDDSLPRACQLIVMSPSGVQKERMVAEDMYVFSSEGSILSTPFRKPYPHNTPKCTDCAPLFLKVYEMRNSGAVIHSHRIEACLITMIHPLSKEFRVTHMEMIKGIKGHGYHDELVVPIIENTALERDLLESLIEAISAYPKTTAVLVRNHGVFIWGDSWISAKTQAECYHYIFDAVIKMHQLGLDCSTPAHCPICNNRVNCGRRGDMSMAPKRGTFDLDYVNEPTHRYILLGIEGTIMPISFVTNTLFSYTSGNVVKHCTVSYNSQDDKWSSGFHSSKLAGVVFDDVPKALELWHASSIKVYLYSGATRDTQQLLFKNSNYGDLRKYICGYFDETVGNKTETRGYLEILQRVGVDRPKDVLFVTSVFQEAVVARAVGLEVMISIRPGNGPLPENHGFRTIESLLEL